MRIEKQLGRLLNRELAGCLQLIYAYINPMTQTRTSSDLRPYLLGGLVLGFGTSLFASFCYSALFVLPFSFTVFLMGLDDGVLSAIGAATSTILQWAKDFILPVVCISMLVGAISGLFTGMGTGVIVRLISRKATIAVNFALWLSLAVIAGSTILPKLLLKDYHSGFTRWVNMIIPLMIFVAIQVIITIILVYRPRHFARR
jgi:hypothetical protein